MARPSRPCLDCPAIITTGNRCPACRRRRATTTSRTRRARGDHWYDDPAWRITRRIYLAHHPNCWCGTAATDVDHIVPRRILLAADIEHPDHPRWLQSLCHRHHSMKTARVDQPLLRRLRRGEPAEALAEEALTAHHHPGTSPHE